VTQQSFQNSDLTQPQCLSFLNVRDKFSHQNFSLPFKFRFRGLLIANITAYDAVMIMTARDKINLSYVRLSIPLQPATSFYPSELTLNNYSAIHDLERGWKRVYVGWRGSDN
jgi:hypothetical protein